MDDGITDLILVGLTLQKIEQTIFTDITFSVQVHHQPGIQVTIVPELVIEVFLYKMKVLKNLIVGYKSYKGSVFFRGLCFFMFLEQNTPFKLCRFFFSFAVSGYFKIITQGIYSLCTYPVQSH